MVNTSSESNSNFLKPFPKKLFHKSLDKNKLFDFIFS